MRSEVAWGRHRFDFLLAADGGRKMILEVKSVTLVEDGVGLFPDAVTERGRRHVETLSSLVDEGQTEAGVLFVAQRSDVALIRTASRIDPAFSQSLVKARRAGVRILARKCEVRLEGLSLGESVPVDRNGH